MTWIEANSFTFLNQQSLTQLKPLTGTISTNMLSEVVINHNTIYSFKVFIFKLH